MRREGGSRGQVLYVPPSDLVGKLRTFSRVDGDERGFADVRLPAGRRYDRDD